MCAIYAHAGAVIRVTIRRLEAEESGASLSQARDTYRDIEDEGSFACFTKSFFDDVSAFAETNL